MKDPLVYHVAPDRETDRWAIIREGKKAPQADGLSKEKALKLARRIFKKKDRPGLVLVHKTRYIIEQQLRFPAGSA